MSSHLAAELVRMTNTVNRSEDDKSSSCLYRHAGGRGIVQASGGHGAGVLIDLVGHDELVNFIADGGNVVKGRSPGVDLPAEPVCRQRVEKRFMQPLPPPSPSASLGHPAGTPLLSKYSILVWSTAELTGKVVCTLITYALLSNEASQFDLGS
eukprot:762948-Hanusia_phi.AAC.1